MVKHKLSILLIITIQILAALLIPIPSKAVETYEGGVAVINKAIPLNRFNASTQTLETEDNPRFLARTGYNVSDFVARNMNYQNRESYFNDTLYNMNTTLVHTRGGYYMGLIPQLNASTFAGVRNFSLVPEQMESTERLQAVGQKYTTDFVGAQAVMVNTRNYSGYYMGFGGGFVDGSIIGGPYANRLLAGFMVGSLSGINFLYDINCTNPFDWVMDFTCNRYGVSLIIGEYDEYFNTSQTWISAYNTTAYGIPQYVYINSNAKLFKCYWDMVDIQTLSTYLSMSIAEMGQKGPVQINPMGVEGLDGRLLGYSINNTLYPDNTFYPDRFDQVYQLFYEPYQNFESQILSYDYISDSDYISMAYEYIGNRWISGESGETFFPTDEYAHFFIDYSNVKRHILLSGNKLLILAGGILEYIATYTFQSGEIPSDWSYNTTLKITDDYGAHFHDISSQSGSANMSFLTSQNLTSWSLELYAAIPNGQSLDIYLNNNQADNQLQIKISDLGVDLYFNSVLQSTSALDYADGIWHRIDIASDPYALIDVEIDGFSPVGGTVVGYLPAEMRNITFTTTDSACYLDAIGVVGDMGYTEDMNYNYYNPSTYTVNFENTIFDKRTSGVAYTWVSDHNRYNLSTEYFNFKITFQIFIDYIRLYVNGTDDWTYMVLDYKTPSSVLRNSYLKRMINFELWTYPYFDGSDYRLGLDFTYDDNRTVIYLDWLDPIDFSLSNSIRSQFTMNDVDLVKCIVFTSTIKSLLRETDSQTRLLSFVNRHYLSRKILYYRFTDSFDFAATDMKIYIQDGAETRELTNANSIIPLNLTASQLITQTNTTQYNNAECLTQVGVFNKSVQLYSESGYNVSRSINDSVLAELPVEGQISLSDLRGPLSAQWYKSVGNAIRTAAVIVQQAAANPIGTILGLAVGLKNGYIPIKDPIRDGNSNNPIRPLPIGVGQTLRVQISDDIGTDIKTDEEDPQKKACDYVKATIEALKLVFSGSVLTRKIYELLQLNRLYEVCYMIEAAWNFITKGVDPTTISNVKLSISVSINGIFSFTETTASESWITMIIKFLVPFILPITLGATAKRFNKKFVPIGIVMGIIIDGFAKMIGWDYVLVFAILGGLGAYFLLNRPSIGSNNDSLDSSDSGGYANDL